MNPIFTPWKNTNCEGNPPGLYSNQLGFSQCSINSIEITDLTYSMGLFYGDHSMAIELKFRDGKFEIQKVVDR